jgi:hypothetical protein
MVIHVAPSSIAGLPIFLRKDCPKELDALASKLKNMIKNLFMNIELQKVFLA